MFAVVQKNPNLHREWIILSLTDDRIAKAVKTIERERIQSEASAIFDHFSDRLKIRTEPASLLLAQRSMDDIVSYMVLQGFDVESEIVLRETAEMIGSYLDKK
nr:hypothetical protein CH379_14120 [Leptospira ellisii]